ncbi:Pro-apoptotic serine protease NMA111 [Aulographum hederae CBS 113979]|uniref:Pro-apoptotic serine protease NMA111 n=1 Tax=Aulographum hederae CBS 113979 TaxID=1176131 RepID=A0A6G1GXJ1_9PEZI|nr:Pro-apoptotic serine protease NMA111 [Aulographum hederae CBS 113979]
MDNTNGTSHSKRKQPPAASSDHRPVKQLKSEQETPVKETDMAVNGSHGSGDMPIANDRKMSRITSMPADSAEWQATVERVIKSVVSIHFCQTCSFDTDPALASEATGFVVDAEKGYIMTNRHVVGAGPFWGYCVFDNHEECDVYPVYRDPVHDFGILRFDPTKIRYMPLAPLNLRPDLARIGVEIRVVGNDAGEKLSILSGVISRLDRNAPEYGEGYSDFNTNYIQAAAAASGGSSGSPVVNIDGHAVALQAGGRSDGAATDYFLPLDRPLRVLECIQRGEPVSRGTIQTQWLLKPFDECRRLGLTPGREAEVRAMFPEEIGMLCAEVVLPKGPADNKLEEGDVLIKVNGELLTKFVPLDDILDSSVGGKVTLLVQREGQEIETTIEVGDLHAITPDRFVSVAGASFHDLSYQQARLHAVALKSGGVYVCEAAGSFRFYDGGESGWLVQAIDNKDTPDLATFIEVVRNIPDRSRVVVLYKHLRDLHTLNTLVINMDRHWSPKMRMAVRNDVTGLWDFTDIADAIAPESNPPMKASFTQISRTNYPDAAEIIKSFVKVSSTMPIKLDGFPRGRKTGHGLVINAEKGLVIVSRAIVPYDLCDIVITIADSIVVAGKVVFMHPLQNYAIIQYDPSLVQAPVKSAKLATSHIAQGEETVFFGFNQNYRPVIGKTVVTDITTVAIPASPTTPRYRAINLDAITVDTNLASQCGSGVLVAEDGTVQALWLTYLGERSGSSGKDMEYHLGLSTPMVLPILKQIQEGVVPQLRILNVEIHMIHMSQARLMGVSEAWIERVEREDPERHQLFAVRKVDAGNNDGLLESDVILTLNGKLVTSVAHLDVQYNNATLDAVVVRKQKEIAITVPTVPTTDLETDRVVIFCGAILHRPHHAVRQQISKIHSDIYISGRMRGSPAYQYPLAPTNFITHVNGVATPDLSAFLRETAKIPDNTYFRLKAMSFDDMPWVATLKKCEHYFPTIEFVKDAREELGWRKVVREKDEGGMTGEEVLPGERAMGVEGTEDGGVVPEGGGKSL